MNFLLKAKQPLAIMFASSRDIFMGNSLVGKITLEISICYIVCGVHSLCTSSRTFVGLQRLKPFICVLYKLRHKTMTLIQWNKSTLIKIKIRQFQPVWGIIFKPTRLWQLSVLKVKLKSAPKFHAHNIQSAFEIDKKSPFSLIFIRNSVTMEMAKQKWWSAWLFAALTLLWKREPWREIMEKWQQYMSVYLLYLVNLENYHRRCHYTLDEY